MICDENYEHINADVDGDFDVDDHDRLTEIMVEDIGEEELNFEKIIEDVEDHDL